MNSPASDTAESLSNASREAAAEFRRRSSRVKDTAGEELQAFLSDVEDLVKRVAAEPDNRARIRKIYQLVYARDPSEEEIKLGLDYLRAEPLKEYEENKNKPLEPPAGGGRGRRGGGGGNSGGRKGAPPISEGGAKPDATQAKPDPTNAKPDPTNAKPDPVISKVEAAPAPATEPAAEGGTGAAPETFVAPDAAGGGATAGGGPAAGGPASQENAAQENATQDNAEADNAGMGMGMFGGVPGMGGRRGNGHDLLVGSLRQGSRGAECHGCGRVCRTPSLGRDALQLPAGERME